MISTTISGKRWLLVASTSGESRFGSQADDIQAFWTGVAWSPNVADGKGFETQSDALNYRRSNLEAMEISLRLSEGND